MTLDEAGLVEDPEVMAHRRLRPAERRHEVAGAHLATGGRRDERQQAQAHGVGERRERRRQGGRFLLAEG